MRGVACLVLRLAGVAGVLFLVLGLPAPYPPAEGSASAAAAPDQLVPQAYLPFLICTICVEPPSLTIYGFDGLERDWDWLIATFGAVSLDRGSGSASVRVLRAIGGSAPATLIVRIEDVDGNPLAGVPVVFYWPDAPVLPAELQACGLDRGIVGLTKSNGNAEFSMGTGAYYFPPDGGPHVVWVATEGTDCLGGLGMLGGTEHWHLDSVWRLR